MPRIVSSVGKLSINKFAVTPENTPEYLSRVGDKIDLLIDTLAIAPEDNIATATVNSKSIRPKTVSKIHEVAADSSNLLDNPTFEIGEVRNNYARGRGGSASSWEQYKPVDPGPYPYQGDYVCKYDSAGQTSVATLKGSANDENVVKYAPGVIPAQEGNKYTFSIQALYTNVVPASRTLLSATLEFMSKTGSVLATHSSTEDFSATAISTWKKFTIEDKIAPANTSYIIVGVELTQPASPTEGAIYYIDGMDLIKVLSIGVPGSGTVTNVATGTGLTGGTITSTGTISATGTLADVAGLSVGNGNFVVGDGANFVAESGATARTSMGCGTGDGTTTASNSQTFTNKSGSNSQWTNDEGWTSNTGDITEVTAGDGLQGGGSSGSVNLYVGAGTGIVSGSSAMSLDLDEIATSTSDADGDFFAVVSDGGSQSKLTKANIKLSGMDNDEDWTSNPSGGNAYFQGGMVIAAPGSNYTGLSRPGVEWVGSVHPNNDKTTAGNLDVLSPDATGKVVYTGDFATGTTSRMFLVSWQGNLWYTSSSLNVALASKLEWQETGDDINTWTEVAGSQRMSGFSSYLTYGSYYYTHSVSGSCLVPLSTGDGVRLRYGFYNNTTGVDYSALAYATALDGFSLTITPVDV